MTIRHSLNLIFLLTFVSSGAGAAEDTTIDFAADIRPILSNKCFACHGPSEDSREADLRLDHEVDAKAERDTGRAIVPGQIDKSLLWHRITSDDVDERMPPEETDKPLTEAEIAKLKKWIQDGAPWAQHWAYVKPTAHHEPRTGDQDWASHWIDRFLYQRFEAAGIRPAADADQATLIRRLSFDLRGLPPTPEEVTQFLNDDAPDAWDKWIDRFLRSPAYGERMAVYWLDLVRYADTVGYHGDQVHSITPYRDYVIDAFNDDMPFDRFTREQLAGDLISKPTLDSRIASGYNRLLQTSHEGGVQPKEYLAIYAADRIRNLSAVWLGATLGCAQCHDHKYDPYRMHDFYSMVAFFADLDESQHFTKSRNSNPTLREPELDVLSRQQRRQIADLKAQMENLDPSSSDLQARQKQLQKEIAEIESRKQRTMISKAIKPRTIRLLPRGNWLDDSGPIMEPAVPTFLGKIDTNGRRATRLDLANWLVDAEDGAGLLTARVLANRLWNLFFGAGLARRMDDFGGQGEPPDHPELLDRLAIQIVANDWRLKPTIKLLLESRAYRLQSRPTELQLRRDPQNRLFGHQNSGRLPAEMIRDQMLAVSGLLVTKIGGPSARPAQPAGYYRHLNFPTRKYQQDRNDSQWRRGVYVHWQRQFLHPMLKAFDAPSREECTAKRARSNTPLAALVLLNDPNSIEAAKMFAARVLIEIDGNDKTRLSTAGRWILSRELDPREFEILSELLRANRNEFQAHPQQAKQLLAVGMAQPSEKLDSVEWATWTEIARTLFNLGAATNRY